MIKTLGRLAMVGIAAVVLSSSYSQAGILDQVLFGAKAAPKYEALPPAKLYTKEELDALANGPKLVVLINRHNFSQSYKSEDEQIEKLRISAGKSGAEGMYIFSVRSNKNGTEIGRESFRMEEPNLDKIRFILEKRAETFSDVIYPTDVYMKSIMHHIVAQNFTGIADYILKLILESPKFPANEKNIMLDGYKALLGDKAIDGFKKVKNNRNVEPDVKAHALAMLTLGGGSSADVNNTDTGGSSTGNGNANGNDKLYKLIVTSNNTTAGRLIFDYTKNATPEDTEKLRKLMKNHASETVRTEAGRALVRLHDTDYVENALQAERSEKVVAAIKKEMLLQ
jgi:hypothetical protein